MTEGSFSLFQLSSSPIQYFPLRMSSVTTHLWTRLSSVKWEDTWVERLQFAGSRSLVIKKFPASRSIRLDLYTDANTAKKLREAFGGTVRTFDAAGWKPPAMQNTPTLRIAGKLRIYREKERFLKELETGKGKALLIPGGMAFGTGDHATTARCLQLLVEASESLRKAGKPWSLLDLGCGSGILSLAGELLGAGKILGCDFDLHCVRIAKENAALNNLSLARFVKADVLRWIPPGKTGAFDIVTANLYSTILTAASEMIIGAIRPGGHLILSGILSVEETAILKTFSSLHHLKTLRRGKWSAVMLEKK